MKKSMLALLFLGVFVGGLQAMEDEEIDRERIFRYIEEIKTKCYRAISLAESVKKMIPLQQGQGEAKEMAAWLTQKLPKKSVSWSKLFFEIYEKTGLKKKLIERIPLEEVVDPMADLKKRFDKFVFNETRGVLLARYVIAGTTEVLEDVGNKLTLKRLMKAYKESRLEVKLVYSY